MHLTCPQWRLALKVDHVSLAVLLYLCRWSKWPRLGHGDCLHTVQPWEHMIQSVELGTLILDRLSQTSQFLNFQVLEPRISETNPFCFFQLCRTIPLSSDWVFKVTLAASLPVHAKQLLWDLQRFHTSWPENGSQWRIQRNNQKQETCFLRWVLICFVVFFQMPLVLL